VETSDLALGNVKFEKNGYQIIAVYADCHMLCKSEYFMEGQHWNLERTRGILIRAYTVLYLKSIIYKAVGSIVDHFNCKKNFKCKSDSVRRN
jgi:hypothetical protein